MPRLQSCLSYRHYLEFWNVLRITLTDGDLCHSWRDLHCSWSYMVFVTVVVGLLWPAQCWLWLLTKTGLLGEPTVVCSWAERLSVMEFKLQLVWSQLPNRKKRKLGIVGWKKHNDCSFGFIINNSVNGSGLDSIHKELNLHLKICLEEVVIILMPFWKNTFYEGCASLP